MVRIPIKRSKVADADTPTPRKAKPPRKTAPKKAGPAPKPSLKSRKPAAPAPKAVPVAKSKAEKPVVKATSTKAATENKIPKVPAIKCRALSDEQIKVWHWVEAMVETNPTVVHPGSDIERMEIRNVPPRSQVLFNEVLGLPCYKVYTQEAHCQKILAGMKKYIPKDMMNKKWQRRVYPAA